MAPAATMAPSPISIFDKNVELAPMDAPLLIIDPIESKSTLIGYLSFVKHAHGPMNT